jgi:ribosomal protein L40E
MVSNKEIKNRLKAKREGRNPDNKINHSKKLNNGLICPNCGINNPDYALFCLDCGKSFPSSDESPEKAESLGYVVCDVCHGIYELQEDESSEDFESCQCGGNLTYINNINDLESIKDDSPKSEENFGYVVCDVCFGVHKLSEFESPANYKTCPCGGNYTYIKEIGNIETPTKICVLCDSENPYSAERCSQCGKIFKDYIEYLQTKPYDIEITDNNIRVYHKKNKTILKVNKYDRAKIINFRLTDSFMRKNLEFNYDDHDILLSISTNQAKYIEQFMKYADFPYFVCLNKECKYDKLLKEGQNCPVCGNISKDINSDSYEQFKIAKLNDKKQRKTVNEFRQKATASESKQKSKEEYGHDNGYHLSDTIQYFEGGQTTSRAMNFDLEITDDQLIIYKRKKGLAGIGDSTGKFKVYNRAKMRNIQVNWTLYQLQFNYEGKLKIISPLKDYLDEIEKILLKEEIEKDSEGLIKIVNGFNGQLELYEHKLVIRRKGGWALFSQGLKGDKEILIKHISSIQFKKAGATGGYIQFAFIGGLEAKRGVFQATRDENTVLFNMNQQDDFKEMKRLIENQMLKIQNIKTEIKDELNNLEKLAELRDKGIITNEEFEAKKKKILRL